MPLPSSEVPMTWLGIGLGFAIGFGLGWFFHWAKDTYLVWKLYGKGW